MNHPSQQELLEHATGALRDAGIDDHLAECPRCRSFHRSVAAVEGALHRLAPEQPSSDFTRALLSRIGVREATPLWWLFLRNFAPILAAGSVAIAVMALGSSGGGAPSAGNSLFDTGIVAEWLRGAVDAAGAWLGGAASKAGALHLGGDATKLTLFLACLFAAFGLLDRFLLQPLLRGRRQIGRFSRLR